MLNNIRILQVNLNKSITATESTLQLAVELKADIIAIQEPWLTTNDNYATARSINHTAFIQILPVTNLPVRPRVLFYISRTLEAETFTQNDFKIDPDAMAITIKGSNFQFNLFNVYNQTNAEGEKTLPRAILNTKLPPSSILVLDSNEHHPLWDPLCPTTSQGAQPFIDWIEEQDLELLNTPGVGTFFRPHLSRETVLDLSLVTPDLASKATDWQTIPETGSDHYGLLFSIQTNADLVENPTNQPRFNTAKANWDTFNKELETAIQNSQTLQDMDQISDPRKADLMDLLLGNNTELEQQLEEIGKAITQAIQTAANKAIPITRLGPKPKAWWNKELTKLRQDTSHYRRIFKEKLETTAIHDAYLEKRDFLRARNTYNKAIKDAKRKHWNEFLEKEDPQITKSKEFHLYKENIIRQEMPSVPQHAIPTTAITEAPTFTNYQEKRWDWPALSTTELERACSSQVKSSTPGPDAITQDIITAAYKAQPQTMFRAFSLLFNYGYHPKCWKQATGAVLKKASKPDYSIPKAYRVITLLSCLGKINERITASRLSNLAEITELLHPTQIGGRLKKSAIDAAMLLIDQIQHQKQKGQITSTIFLDVKGAFDHVSHNQFLRTLKKLGLPISLIAWTKSFFSNRSLRLSFDNKTQEFSEIIAGIPQGSPVSPIFFLIYTRDLFPGLQSFNLSYIDDLSLSTSSTSLKKNVKILEQQVRLLSHRGKNLAIMFDIAKTELIHFTAKKERKERSLQLPDNTIVEPKDTIKWLGIHIDNRLSFKEHIATRVSQARKAFYRLGRLANIERGLSPKAVRQLYLACVTSVADYGSQIYWKNQSYATSLLQSLHNLACRKIIGVFRTSPSLPTSIESGLTSPAIRLNTNNRKYASRAHQLSSNHPIQKAITRITNTDKASYKKPNQHRQLYTIVKSIPERDNNSVEKIIPYRAKRKRQLHTRIISYQGAEITSPQSTQMPHNTTRNRDRRSVVAYSSTHEETFSQKTNIGCSQLVYNGELEGIAQAFEHAATVAQEGQEIYVYADNQAAIHRLNNLSDNPGQQWLLRCIRAAKRITTKKASIHLQWAPGHNDVKGNEKADTLAKEAAKERPTTSTTASLAYLGTEINKIQKTEQLMEYKRYTDRPTKNRSSYSRIFKLNTHTTIKVPKGTPREISSAFYSLKLGHGYFNSYLKRFNKRDCNLCICYKPQTPQHLLLDCKQYKTHRNTLKEAIPHRPITLPLLLQTKTGIKATLAFIASTRIGTRKWHLGQTTEQTDTV
ncbi:uncharacterized protein PtrM4_153550 [Pyrenophora tritici-repentis]|uniref:Reverse transcriptase n=1 Tax=Pyrenophora tritici-repentis TaxID=45151 RepID=A0A834RIN3_9PLEO|nr:hypothetical protein PtrM4_153550 [Pyrenophora tritici-repentis]